MKQYIYAVQRGIYSLIKAAGRTPKNLTAKPVQNSILTDTPAWSDALFFLVTLEKKVATGLTLPGWLTFVGKRFENNTCRTLPEHV